MTGVLEVGAVATLSTTAASTFGACTYAHVQPCFEGLLKKKPKQHQKRNALDPPVAVQLHAGPLKSQVPVKINNSSVGKHFVEFNGEVLFTRSSATGPLEPKMALGACDVKVCDTSVIAAPPTVPTVELTFSTPMEAQRWADEFKVATLLGPPQQRIQELIAHCVSVEKHIDDLRARSARVSKLEENTKKLKRSLTDLKAGCGVHDAGGSSISLGSLFGSHFAHGNDEEEKEKLNEQLRKHHEELEKAQSLNEKMKSHIADNARSNHEVELRWKNFVGRKVQQDKEQEERIKIGMRVYTGTIETSDWSVGTVKGLRADDPNGEDRYIVQLDVNNEGVMTYNFQVMLVTEVAAGETKTTEEVGDCTFETEPEDKAKVEPQAATQQRPPYTMAIRDASRQSAQGLDAISKSKQADQEFEQRFRIRAQEFEQRFKEVENQLAFSRQSFQERLSANGPNVSMVDLSPEKESLTVQGEELANTDRSKIDPLLSTRCLEARIRSHQLQVYQDCDVLQQNFKPQFL